MELSRRSFLTGAAATLAVSSTGVALVIPEAGAAAPALANKLGWLECNGQTVSRSAYAALFEVIGTIFGEGDGQTTFTLPNYNPPRGAIPPGVIPITYGINPSAMHVAPVGTVLPFCLLREGDA